MGPISEMDMVSVLSCSYIFLSDMVVVKKFEKKENLFWEKNMKGGWVSPKYCGFWSTRILHYFPLSVRPSVRPFICLSEAQLILIFHGLEPYIFWMLTYLGWWTWPLWPLWPAGPPAPPGPPRPTLSPEHSIHPTNLTTQITLTTRTTWTACSTWTTCFTWTTRTAE